jgi:hypothetical protein
MSWLNHRAIGGVALVLAGLYGLIPLRAVKRGAELCALLRLAFQLDAEWVRSWGEVRLSCTDAAPPHDRAAARRYVVRRLIVVAAPPLVYKLAPAPAWKGPYFLSAAVAALGPIFVLMGEAAERAGAVIWQHDRVEGLNFTAQGRSTHI